MSTETTCPNCSAKITKGVFAWNNELKPANVGNLINEFREDKKAGYCEKCYTKESEKAGKLYEAEVERLGAEAKEIIGRVPIVSSHSPADWEYETLGIVTGQAVMGTGFFSELSSGISDLLGTQSSALSDKIRVGERTCYAQVRWEAFKLGGNAILALDIDYNEMGGQKGMVMVCMTGTAVFLKNSPNGDLIAEYNQRIDRINHLKAVAKSSHQSIPQSF